MGIAKQNYTRYCEILDISGGSIFLDLVGTPHEFTSSTNSIVLNKKYNTSIYLKICSHGNLTFHEKYPQQNLMIRQ